MDIETSEAVDSLRTDLRQVETSLRAEIRRVETTLTEKIESRIAASESALRAEMRQIRDETRRHAEVLFESLHDDIRMVADGLASLGTKVDALSSPGSRG